jgi:hypothetical protein
MTIDRLHRSPEMPEWQPSVPYLLLAIALHAALLFYPMRMVSGMLKTMPPLSATLKMEQAAPAPVVEPAKVPPSPPPVASTSRRERPVPKPRTVIAMTPEQAVLQRRFCRANTGCCPTTSRTPYRPGSYQPGACDIQPAAL